MQLLPKWVLTDKHPAFYDIDSGSAIEQTARVYGAMQELIKEYNTFADNVNKIITDFKAETKEEQDCFKRCITELVQNYIETIDNKIDRQDLKIDNAVKYMKDNILETATEIVQDTISSGVISLVESYDPETETLNIVVSGGAE